MGKLLIALGVVALLIGGWLKGGDGSDALAFGLFVLGAVLWVVGGVSERSAKRTE